MGRLNQLRSWYATGLYIFFPWESCNPIHGIIPIVQLLRTTTKSRRSQMKLFRALFVKNGNLLECIVRIRFPITAGTWSCIHFQNRSIYVFDLISFYFPSLSFTRSLVRLFRKPTYTECTMHCCRKLLRPWDLGVQSNYYYKCQAVKKQHVKSRKGSTMQFSNYFVGQI